MIKHFCDHCKTEKPRLELRPCYVATRYAGAAHSSYTLYEVTVRRQDETSAEICDPCWRELMFKVIGGVPVAMPEIKTDCSALMEGLEL